MNKIKKLLYEHNFFEKRAWLADQYVIGIDEAGRGCLAGPVVAAAVIIPRDTTYILLQDSKKLSSKKRKEAFEWITNNCIYTVGIIDNSIIDQINIYNATIQAMDKALLLALETIKNDSKKYVIKNILIDAMPLGSYTSYNTSATICSFNFGEDQSASIAAASIIAKETRDALMLRYAQDYPEYCFEKHKGYGTALHRDMIKIHGVSSLHRVTFLNNIITTNAPKECKNSTLF